MYYVCFCGDVLVCVCVCVFTLTCPGAGIHRCGPVTPVADLELLYGPELQLVLSVRQCISDSPGQVLCLQGLILHKHGIFRTS